MDTKWLIAYLAVVKQWLNNATATEIATLYALLSASGAGEENEKTRHAIKAYKTVVENVYSLVRLSAYLAWFAQVCLLRVEAQKHGVKHPYVPSMLGVSPKYVERVLREELRIQNGKIKAPLDETIQRTTRRLNTVIHSTARRTTVYASTHTKTQKQASVLYSLQNGTPQARFLKDTLDETTQIGKTLKQHPHAQKLLDETLTKFETAYTPYQDKPLTKITRQMLDNHGDLKTNLTKAELENIAQAYKHAALAEIELTDTFKVYPSNYYYQWVKNYRTGKVEYIAPPKNAVFEWLKGELGMHAPVTYYTEKEYRDRAKQIINSKPDSWWEKNSVRWARIPTGAYTCAFCLVLASRGPVYYTSTSAKLNGFDHDDCDCVCVPVYDDDNYPFHEVISAVQDIYADYKDEFQIRYSRNLYEVPSRKNKGGTVLRHKKYVYIPRHRLAQITKNLPRIDNEGYKQWEKEWEKSIAEKYGW